MKNKTNKDACYYKIKKSYKVFTSAYASGAIAQCRKNKGKKKMNRTPLRKDRKTEKGATIRRVFKEEWRTPSGEKDYSKRENLFKTTKRVSKTTATTYGELTKSELRAAQKEKNSKGRVSRFKKKKKK